MGPKWDPCVDIVGPKWAKVEPKQDKSATKVRPKCENRLYRYADDSNLVGMVLSTSVRVAAAEFMNINQNRMS